MSIDNTHGAEGLLTRNQRIIQSLEDPRTLYFDTGLTQTESTVTNWFRPQPSSDVKSHIPQPGQLPFEDLALLSGQPPTDIDHVFRASSPALSATPCHLPDVLYCAESGCSACFTGTHRRGTLHRHIRLKHKGQQYPCRVCDKVFQRQDARLKHYRGKHSDNLELPAAVRRK